MPATTSAGFLLDLLGADAVAGAPETISSNQPTTNSQNMALLQANVYSVSIIDDKKQTKTTKKDEESTIKKDVDINIVSDNALSPATSPLGVSDGTASDEESFSDQVSVYVVHKGDTIAGVADLFGVTADTILSANDMKKGDKLKEGMVILVLPFSGVEHAVTKGQTIASIAKLYKADVEEILIHNDLKASDKLAVGDKIMIPGGTLQSEATTKKDIAKKPSGGATGTTIKNIIGKFINPVPGSIRTRGITSSHKGVDLAAPEGTPIKSVASGTVELARKGYNGGFGNMVIVRGDDGVKVLYAHMVRIGTSTGDRVSQGEVIGNVGNTGHSRGDHLHIEILNAKNPF